MEVVSDKVFQDQDMVALIIGVLVMLDGIKVVKIILTTRHGLAQTALVLKAGVEEPGRAAWIWQANV